MDDCARLFRHPRHRRPPAEEFGWRGYALDRLQNRFNALLSSVILGLIWGLWHLPLFGLEGSIQQNVPIWAFVLGTVLFSVILTWLYNNTGGSILAVILLHTTGNLAHYIFPAMATTWGGPYSLLLNLLVAGLIVLLWGPRRMVRGQVPAAGMDQARL